VSDCFANSTNAVFFASADPKTKDKTRQMTPSKIALSVNEETIWRSTIVFAADQSLASFVIRRVEGKATGSWQPSAPSSSPQIA
jgi:hypothetical protein